MAPPKAANLNAAMNQLVPDRYTAAREHAREMARWYRDNPVNICGADVVWIQRL